jgi:LAO/AO transport system kinase
MTSVLSPDDRDLADRLAAGERAALARAITLVESKRADHRARAGSLIQHLLPRTGHAQRIGMTGVPGVGKSTSIEALGTYLTARGKRVAVLAVDPSSTRTGGSILGDKTRMEKLATDPSAYIRPSPSAGTLGGVAAKTRETMLLCEAAGYDVILVETVGIGQSETAVADMTDMFVVLMLPGAGDELQGIKKGVLELADLIAVNKADGDNVIRAEAAAGEYRAALHILQSGTPDWTPPVLTYSARTGTGIDRLWETIGLFFTRTTQSGRHEQRRRDQQVKWMWALLDERLKARLTGDPVLAARLPEIEKAVASGARTATLAADEIAGLLNL